MTELPEFTVVTSEGFASNGSPSGFHHAPKVLIKRNGRWFDQDGFLFVSTDPEVWEYRPDAVVVALPTAQPLTRENAVWLHQINEEIP